MNIQTTALSGVVIVTSPPHTDQRGTFSRFFCKNELSEIIGNRELVQVNQSRTSMLGAVRGLHYQSPPHAEMKLVRCIRGRIWDVAVDLRAGSPTFLQWHAEELTPQNTRMIVIPEGCAHGFQVLEEDSELLYLHTAYYTPAAEAGLRHDEARLGITWPLPITDLSARDRDHPPLHTHFSGMTV